MDPVCLIIEIAWLHFFSDFVLQTDSMAQNKSKSNYWLTIHILVYMAPFLILGWQYALVNGAVHWVVDWFTSRINSYNWQKKRVHLFFVGVGADQAIHFTTLLITLPLIR